MKVLGMTAMLWFFLGHTCLALAQSEEVIQCTNLDDAKIVRDATIANTIKPTKKARSLFRDGLCKKIALLEIQDLQILECLEVTLSGAREFRILQVTIKNRPLFLLRMLSKPLSKPQGPVMVV